MVALPTAFGDDDSIDGDLQMTSDAFLSALSPNSSLLATVAPDILLHDHCKGISHVARRICLAPMMDYTDRHFRYLIRQITRTALLYTEMIPAGAIIHGHQTWLLKYDPVEHPVAVQFGGNDPAVLAECARIAADLGYDEINLNLGCPSARVAGGRFGACLMTRPELVARCIEAMVAAVTIPVTVKHRIGVDKQDSYADLLRFVTMTAGAGCSTFIVHARKAWLKGLSPKHNRSLPPLDHTMVHRLKADRPSLTIVTNGGITSLAEGIVHLKHVDGVMIGRAAYKAPCLLADVDYLFKGCTSAPLSRHRIIAEMVGYLTHEAAAGTPPLRILRHLHGLFHGQLGARYWRRRLATLATYDPISAVRILQEIADYL